MLTNQKPLHEIVEGEPHSLYVDGKPNIVKLSVFQEQNKQIKKFTLQVKRFLLFWCGVPRIILDTHIFL